MRTSIVAPISFVHSSICCILVLAKFPLEIREYGYWQGFYNIYIKFLALHIVMYWVYTIIQTYRTFKTFQTCSFSSFNLTHIKTCVYQKIILTINYCVDVNSFVFKYHVSSLFSINTLWLFFFSSTFKKKTNIEVNFI